MHNIMHYVAASAVRNYRLLFPMFSSMQEILGFPIISYSKLEIDTYNVLSNLVSSIHHVLQINNRNQRFIIMVLVE